MFALLCTGIINDKIDPQGKAEAGAADFIATHRTLQRIARVQEHFREQGHLVIHTKTAFKDNYAEYPTNSGSKFTPDLKAKGAFQRGEWGTEIPAEVAPKENEPVIIKHRIGAFDRTRLELILRTKKIEHLFVVGGYTSSSVTSIAFAAHDADLNVTILADSCFDVDQANHDLGLQICQKIAEVTDFDQIAMRLTK